MIFLCGLFLNSGGKKGGRRQGILFRTRVQQMISTEKNAILFMPAPFTCRTLKSLGFFVNHLDWCPTVVFIYLRHSQLLPLKWDKVERKVSRASSCPLCPAAGVSAVSCSLELCMGATQGVQGDSGGTGCGCGRGSQPSSSPQLCSSIPALPLPSHFTSPRLLIRERQYHFFFLILWLFLISSFVSVDRKVF